MVCTRNVPKRAQVLPHGETQRWLVSATGYGVRESNPTGHVIEAGELPQPLAESYKPALRNSMLTRRRAV